LWHPPVRSVRLDLLLRKLGGLQLRSKNDRSLGGIHLDGVLKSLIAGHEEQLLQHLHDVVVGMLVVVQQDYVVKLGLLVVLARFGIRERQDGTCHVTILRRQPLRLQLPQPAQPPFVVIGLILEELGDFGVGKHQELLRVDRGNRRLGHR